MISQFSLFRLLLPSRSDSVHLFTQNSAEMLRKAILNRPGAIVRGEIMWVIANTQAISDDVVYFKFGRVMKRSGEVFDAEQWLFVQKEIDIANCAVCLFDASTQVLAIENATDCPTEYTLSKYIKKIINKFISGKIFNYFSPEEIAYIKTRECEVGEVSDPVDFITAIMQSHRVSECRLYASRTNPIDYDDLFQRPVGRLMDMAGANFGYTKIRTTGNSLQQSVIVDLAKSSAAVGNDVVAKLQREEGALPEVVRLHSKTSCARVDVESGEGDEWLRSLVRTIRSKYASIRGER